MKAVLLLWVSFAAAALVCEPLIRGCKLQSVLRRVMAVHVVALWAAIGLLVPGHHLNLSAIVIFWSGGFLAWFGIRSHLESSILLRMLHSLRCTSMTEADLVASYEGTYGEARRVDELIRAGLVTRNSGTSEPRVTRKGAMVVRVVQGLR